MYLEPTARPGDPVCVHERCPRYGKPEYGRVCTSCGHPTATMATNAPVVPQQIGVSPQVHAGGVAMPGAPSELGSRFLARLIDLAVIIVPLCLIGLLLPDFPDAAEVAGGAEGPAPPIDMLTSILGLVWFLSALLYEVVMLAANGGQTIGKRIMRVRVVRLDGSPIGWGPAAGRVYVQGFASACTCGLGGIVFALSPLFDNGPWRRGWPDKIASTVVIRA